MVNKKVTHKTVVVSPETKATIQKMKLDNQFKTEDQVINYLLDRANLTDERITKVLFLKKQLQEVLKEEKKNV